MRKAVITPAFEKHHAAPAMRTRQEKRKQPKVVRWVRRSPHTRAGMTALLTCLMAPAATNGTRGGGRRQDTAGAKWFNMPAPDITPEIKRDLQLLKLRNVLDPKRFYKKDTDRKLPKYFQVRACCRIWRARLGGLAAH